MMLRRFAFLLAILSAPSFAHAQLIDASSGALRFDVPAEAVSDWPTIVPDPVPLPEPEWVDLGRVIDALRIPEKPADLRAVTVDAAGKNYGFYFASQKKEAIAVYRNGRRMVSDDLETLADLAKPTVFRMTASGDLLFALHGADLYVNETPVSLDQPGTWYAATQSVVDEGGRLFFPEGGSVVEYDVKTATKRTLYRHPGNVLMVRKAGSSFAYTVREGTAARMYRNGRRVSAVSVANPHNFDLSKAGDVYYFAAVPRGYALYRNARAYATGKDAGAFVQVDPSGAVWHLSYAPGNPRTNLRLRKNRSTANLLPKDAVNMEMSLLFLGGGYAARVSFASEPTHFFLVRDGEKTENAFLFEPPYSDTHGLRRRRDAVVLRAFDEGQWRILQDGVPMVHPTLKRALFFAVDGEKLTIYAME